MRVFLPLPYSLAACTSHKCSLNDHNSSVTVSAKIRDKMSTVLVRREDELHADIRYVTVEQSIYRVLLSIADRKIICLSRLGRHFKGFLYNTEVIKGQTPNSLMSLKQSYLK